MDFVPEGIRCLEVYAGAFIILRPPHDLTTGALNQQIDTRIHRTRIGVGQCNLLSDDGHPLYWWR